MTILLTIVDVVEAVPKATDDVEDDCDCVTKTDGNNGFGISTVDCVGIGGGGCCDKTGKAIVVEGIDGGGGCTGFCIIG